MNKALIAVVAAAIGLAPISVLPGSPAHADPSCEDFPDIPGFAESCERLEATCQQGLSIPQVGQQDYENCEEGKRQAIQQAQEEQRQRTSPATPTTTQASATPSSTAASTTEQAPVSTPQSQPNAIAPPKGLNAPQSAIDAAKQNVSQADPANPPRSPDGKDVNQRVRDVITHHSRDVDVVKGRVYPRHWDYTDHDQDGNPVLVNPTNDGTTFRYFYQGSYQEAYVEAGSSVSFTGITGVFPFAAVGDTYLASGTFYGGSPPTVYQNVDAYLPSYGQTVQIGTVQIIGHDDSQPAGEQDAMMLNDTTLARGQATNPSDGGQVTVAKTQTLPGVGPTDDGKSLVDLAAASQPSDNTGIIVASVVGIGLALLALGGFIWVIRRRKRAA